MPPEVVYLKRSLMTELFSLTEAAAIAEIPPATIRTALEKKSVTPSHTQKTGNAIRHRFSAADVLLVKVLAEFPFPLSARDKQSLAGVLAQGRRQAANWSLREGDLVYRAGDMQVVIECKPFRQTVDRNLAAYRWGSRRVVSSPAILGGEPVFRGTRIPLQHVASLFRKGAPEQEIAEDFPGLSARDLAYARLAARFGARPGRPKKRLVIQREHAPL
jgi:uncharacterized protein (DUF433 family)